VLADFQATVGHFRAKFGQFNHIHDQNGPRGSAVDPHEFLGVDGVHLLAPK